MAHVSSTAYLRVFKQVQFLSLCATDSAFSNSMTNAHDPARLFLYFVYDYFLIIFMLFLHNFY